MFSIRRAGRLDGSQRGEGYLDCTACKRELGEVERRAIRCGHLPRLPEADPETDPERRVPHPLLPRAAPRPHDQVCPGYLIVLPQVLEALEAHWWWEKGQLAEYLDGRAASPHFRETVTAVACAIGDAEVAAEAERRQNQDR